MPQYLGAFRDRITIKAFKKHGTGLVAGVLVPKESKATLRDGSGELELSETVTDLLPSVRTCWLALRFHEPERAEIVYLHAIEASGEVHRFQDEFEGFQKRWSIHQAVRRFFLDRDFLEVDTPLAVPCPGMEPYLDSFSLGGGRYLRTSPELHMKRLLAGGFDNFFQMGPCFRAGDRGKLHREEFLLLEWYRAFADLDRLVDDLRSLLAELARFSAHEGYFCSPFQIHDCRTLFRNYLDLDLRGQEDREPLRACLRERRIGFDEADDWDTLYFLLFLNFIEPHLGKNAPEIVTGYPASQAALAKMAPPRPDSMPTCYRFELYIHGVEIANAFYELTDAEEQRLRFEADCRKRAQLGKTVYPIDEDFMAALGSGLPPCAGIALGLDRLVLALLDMSALDHILPF